MAGDGHRDLCGYERERETAVVPTNGRHAVYRDPQRVRANVQRAREKP
jgi:hypothetical protein